MLTTTEYSLRYYADNKPQAPSHGSSGQRALLQIVEPEALKAVDSFELCSFCTLVARYVRNIITITALVALSQLYQSHGTSVGC